MKAAHEGGDNKFTFFQSNGKILSDFETVYNLHMRIGALSKALESYAVKDVFGIFPELTVQRVNTYLKVLFACQETKAEALAAAAENSTDNSFINAAILASRVVQATEGDVKAVEITTIDMLSSFQDLDTATIRQLNQLYAMYGPEATVKNLVWSADLVLNSCEDSLRGKVREGLVGGLLLDAGGLLTLKLIIGIIMDVNDSAL